MNEWVGAVLPLQGCSKNKIVRWGHSPEVLHALATTKDEAEVGGGAGGGHPSGKGKRCSPHIVSTADRPTPAPPKPVLSQEEQMHGEKPTICLLRVCSCSVSGCPEPQNMRLSPPLVLRALVQDKPWAHPDPPAAESWGFGGGGGNGGDGESEEMREGRLRTNLFLILVSIIVLIWVYRKFVKRDRTPFFYVPPTPTEEATVRGTSRERERERDVCSLRLQSARNGKSRTHPRPPA